MTALSEATREAIARLAAAPILLVGSDYDGVIAPIAPTPDDARPDPAVVEALRELSALRSTHVAVISGRDRSTLQSALAALSNAAILVGGHGASFGGHCDLNEERREALDRIGRMLESYAASMPGALVERKSVSCTLHYRRSDPVLAERAIERLLNEASALAGVHVLTGHKVVELGVVRPDKGEALMRVRHRVGAQGTLFLGDDVTDESAFERLASEADAPHSITVGIKVGPGTTAASFRLRSQDDVSDALRELLDRRRSWLAVEEADRTPIQRHAVLSDQRTVVLVDPRGRVSWACLPRIDAPAMFAALLDGEDSGSFDVSPEGVSERASQSYIDDSFVLRSRWSGSEITLTDYLDCSGGKAFQRAGRSDLIRVVEGSGRVRIRFAPRLDFGRSRTRLAVRDGGVEIEGWLDPVVLVSPGVEWSIVEEGSHQTATASVALDGRVPLVLELRYGSASVRPSPQPERVRREQTQGFWTGWVQTLELPRLAPSLVRRSALVLKALCHGPTGAIAAAGTTSLPEQLGGVRNWDYRYCWPRDAALSASALVRLGSTGIGLRLLDWLSEVVAACPSPDRLRPIYDVSGRDLGPEGEIGEMRGYARSRPVRVGNAAANQVQLDVFGPIVELVALLAQRGAPITPQYWRLVEAMVGAVASRWREPDHGIWEVRDTPRHHVHSKVMCWMAVDRALVICDAVTGRSRTDWESLRDEIGDDVLRNGYNDSIRAFPAWYGGDAVDAASLWVGLSGLVPASDPRFVATVEAVERELLDGVGVYRYLCDDGLPGVEGVFHLCTAWLVESLAMIGRHDQAMTLLNGLCEAAGPLGLLSEELDPRHGIALGNYPQAYSHLGVINAAVRMSVLNGDPHSSRV